MRRIPRSPYIAGNPVHDDEMFYGRKSELKSISNFVKQDQTKVLLLKGERRAGKTSILIKSGRDLKKEAETVVCNFQHIAPEIKTDEDLPFKIGEAMLKVDEFGEFRDSFLKSEGSWTEKLGRLTEECLKKISPRKLVLLCDEHELFNGLFQKKELTSEALKWAKNMMDLPVYFIIAGANDLGENLDIFSVSQKTEIRITLSKDDAEKLIINPAKKDFRYSDDAIEKIYRLSGRQPFYIQLICNVIFKNIVEANRKYAEPTDVDEAIRFIITETDAGHIVDTWGKQQEFHNILKKLAHSLKDSDDYMEKNHPVLLKNRFAIESLERNNLIYRRPDDKSVNFKVEIFRLWIQRKFGHEDETTPESEPDDKEKKKVPEPPGIMKWIPAIALIVLLFVGWVVYNYVVKPVPHPEPGTGHKNMPPVMEIADITGFEFIVCDYDETAKKDKLYLLNSSGKKELLFKNMEEPQSNPSISLDNEWLVFQKGKGDDDLKICVVNLRKKKFIIGDKDKEGKEGRMPAISPKSTADKEMEIVFIPLKRDFEKEKCLLKMILNTKENTISQPRCKFELPKKFTEILYPVYLQDNESVAFIGRTLERSDDIFLYDPANSFKYDHEDDSKYKIRELTHSQGFRNLTASLNKLYLLYSSYSGESKQEIVHLKILKLDEKSLGHKDINADIAEGIATFCLTNDKIISVKNKQIFSSEWEPDVKQERVNIKKTDVIKTINLNQPTKIITLKGGVK